MDNKLIKIFSQDKANELISLGFKYTTESVNGKTVYVFFSSKEIMRYVQSNFSKNDFLLSKRLTF